MTSSRRSVVHVMGWESLQYGSFERFLVKLSDAVNTSGADMHLVFPTQPPSDAFVDDVAADVHVVPSAGAAVDPRFLLRISRLLDSLSASHVHVHHGFDAYQTLALPRRQRRRYFTKHNTPTMSQRRALQHRWLASRVDKVLAVSEMVGDRLIEFGVPRHVVEVCYLGVDPDRYRRQDARRLATRQELGLRNDQRLVLTTSHLRPWKGVEGLPDLASGLSREPGGVLVAVAGSGPLEQQLRDRAAFLGLSEDQFRMLGTRNDVPALLSAADLFVFPTTSGIEGFPLSVMEALATGVPIVAADVVTDFRSVFDGVIDRYAPGDADSLIQRCRRWLADSSGARSRTAVGQEIVSERMTTDHAVQGYLKAYGL